MSLLSFSCFPDDEPDEVSREKNIISSFLLANLSTVDVSKYVQKKVLGGRKGKEREKGGKRGREVREVGRLERRTVLETSLVSSSSPCLLSPSNCPTKG